MLEKKYLFTVIVLSLILGSWKGYVALFEKNASEPRQIFPCQVSTLPPADQAAVEKGIPILNQRDLEKILEDYLS